MSRSTSARIPASQPGSGSPWTASATSPSGRAAHAAAGACPSARNSLPISSGGRSGASPATSTRSAAPAACSAANASGGVAARTISVPGHVTASASGWSGGSSTRAGTTSSSPATTS
ncbi:hypothetical protein [Actinomadura sp. CNU-125]|uniref:hypothetical protein n=1 Tax=Actinomadura sp. CNU-125 TaxID=1904961 RepID=UPI00130183B1|nr:hypothetical protein [Actinomadura sp. CNU-125]